MYLNIMTHPESHIRCVFVENKPLPLPRNGGGENQKTRCARRNCAAHILFSEFFPPSLMGKGEKRMGKFAVLT
jgi:hypothetical protein